MATADEEVVYSTYASQSPVTFTLSTSTSVSTKDNVLMDSVTEEEEDAYAMYKYQSPSILTLRTLTVVPVKCNRLPTEMARDL